MATLNQFRNSVPTTNCLHRYWIPHCLGCQLSTTYLMRFILPVHSTRMLLHFLQTLVLKSEGKKTSQKSLPLCHLFIICGSKNWLNIENLHQVNWNSWLHIKASQIMLSLGTYLRRSLGSFFCNSWQGLVDQKYFKTHFQG